MFINKRFMALILAALLLLTVAGCGEKAPQAEEPGDTPQSAATPAEAGGYEYDDVYALFEPDTPMILAGEYTVAWEEMFYYLCSSVAMLESEFGEITDWTQLIEADMTLADAVKVYAEDGAISGKVLEYGAKLLGAELSETDIAAIQASYDSLAEQYGGEDVLLDLLKQNYCYSRELFEYISRAQNMVGLCLATIYGANGDNLTDEEVAAYTEGDGYLRAKHILRMTQNEDRSEKTDEEKAAVLAEIEGIYAQLSEYEGDDFDAFFDELMLEYSEDLGGLQSYPDGYLFQEGNMVKEFFEGCLALDIGAFSEPVKTSYGYHIIYRMPINYDAIPYTYYNEQLYYSLRYITATQMFEAVARGWQDNMEITFTEEYQSLDIVKMFG